MLFRIPSVIEVGYNSFMSLTQALRKLVEEDGRPISIIAEESRIPQPMLARFMKGQGIRLATADRLAEYYGLEVVRIPNQNGPALKKPAHDLSTTGDKRASEQLNKSDMRAERMLRLNALLTAGGTLEHFSQVLRTSERTIFRDIKALKRSGVRVRYSKDHHTYTAEPSCSPGLQVELNASVRATSNSILKQQAKQLVKLRHYSAAMVLLGVLLEEHLRALCDLHQITSDRAAHSAQTYLRLLRTKVLSLNVASKIEHIVKLRNQAAHGHGEHLSKHDVIETIKFLSWLTRAYAVSA
jgi:hypothetical protein